METRSTMEVPLLLIRIATCLVMDSQENTAVLGTDLICIHAGLQEDTLHLPHLYRRHLLQRPPHLPQRRRAAQQLLPQVTLPPRLLRAAHLHLQALRQRLRPVQQRPQQAILRAPPHRAAFRVLHRAPLATHHHHRLRAPVRQLPHHQVPHITRATLRARPSILHLAPVRQLPHLQAPPTTPATLRAPFLPHQAPLTTQPALQPPARHTKPHHLQAEPQ